MVAKFFVVLIPGIGYKSSIGSLSDATCLIFNMQFTGCNQPANSAFLLARLTDRYNCIDMRSATFAHKLHLSGPTVHSIYREFIIVGSLRTEVIYTLVGCKAWAIRIDLFSLHVNF